MPKPKVPSPPHSMPRRLSRILVSASITEEPREVMWVEQRDFAAGIWLRWSRMGVGSGAGVTVKSYTGRILASAEEGLTGPRFHC